MGAAAAARDRGARRPRIESGETSRSPSLPTPWRYAATPAVAAGVGLTASAVAIAYLARATQTGAALDWAFAVVMGLLGGYWLVASSTPARRCSSPTRRAIRIRLGRDLARAAVDARCTTSSTRRGADCCATAGWSSYPTTPS